MPDELEQIRFTTRVLGPVATYKLERRQVTQTLRSGSEVITDAIIRGQASPGDRLQIVLDGRSVGHVELLSMDAVSWGHLNLDDARRGGFNTLPELEAALRRAGFRFKLLNEYHLFRIQFVWLEEANRNALQRPQG